MKATLISATTIACLASVLIADVVRAFPVPSATNDEDIVKLVTRRDQSFVEPPTIRVREEHGVPSFPFVPRSIYVPSIEDIEARASPSDAIPRIPPNFASIYDGLLDMDHDTDLEPAVHEYDNEEHVEHFNLPLPPGNGALAKEMRDMLGYHLKRHLLTLLRKARHSESVTPVQVTHARMRVMQLWVLITAEDLKLLESRPYDPLRQFLLPRRDAADGVVNGQYNEDERAVARECVLYYDRIERAHHQAQRQRYPQGQYALYASEMFDITTRFNGNYDWLRRTPRQA